MKSFDEIVKDLKNNPNVEETSSVIKNVTCTEKEEYVRVALTLKNPVNQYAVDQETGEFSIIESNIIFSSNYAIAAVIKENPSIAFVGNKLNNNNNLIELLLSGARIKILQEKVKAGEYKNPFSSSNKYTKLQNDTIINHIVDIELTDFALESIKDIAKNIIANLK
jgi:hypothetical protein